MQAPVEVKSQLYQELQPFFAAQGFDVLYDKNQYRRNTPSGFQAVILSVTPYEELSYVELILAVQLAEVEKLVQQFTLNLQGYYPDAPTLLVPVSKITGQPHFRYKVYQPADVVRVACEIKEFLLNHGLDFLTQATRISEMDTLFNDHPLQPSPYVFNAAHRCMKGLVIAKMNGRSEWRQLIPLYRRALENANVPDKQLYNFDRLTFFLQSFSMN
jgi:hypothetical protein